MSEARRQRLFLEFHQWGYDHRGWARNTRNVYTRSARTADKWLKEQRSTNLLFAGEKDLRAYLFSLPPNPPTRNSVRQALVWFFRFLVKQGYRRDNPAEELPRLPLKPTMPKALSIDVAERLLRAAHAHGDDTEVMVMLMLFGGLRRAETRLLEWRNIDLEESWLRVDSGAKGGRPRVIPLHPVLRAVLARWREVCLDARFVFPSPVFPDQPLSFATVASRIKEVGEDAGIHLHPHILRHSAAQRLLEKTHNLSTVQEFLGHADPRTTIVYARMKPQAVAAGVARLDFHDPETEEDA
jgi:site-specific recombinase XerD